MKDFMKYLEQEHSDRYNDLIIAMENNNEKRKHFICGRISAIYDVLDFLKKLGVIDYVDRPVQVNRGPLTFYVKTMDYRILKHRFNLSNVAFELEELNYYSSYPLPVDELKLSYSSGLFQEYAEMNLYLKRRSEPNV